jgi:hypothetical protein
MKSISDYLGSTESLIQSENNENLPLFIQFQYQISSAPNQIETDEAEAIFAYDDGFAVPANGNDLPEEWRLTDPDPMGNALFKIPVQACVAFQHRKLRRKRYHENVRCRRYAA